MAIKLTQDQQAAIRQHGEETFPHECCGFMLGKANGEAKTVGELLRADNDREDGARHNRFLITPEAYMRGEKAARAKGLDIIGFYHSHPNAPARPSQYDLDHAWPFYSYVIVSILDKKSDAMTSWVLKEDRSKFDEEAIVAP
jgi:proteasome lid subunit RPN8/RPN11